MTADPRPSSALKALRRVWREGRATPGFSAMIACGLLAAVFNSAIILPISMEQVIAMVPDRGNLAAIYRLLALSFGLLLAGYAAEWSANRLAAKVNQRICLRLAERQVQGYLRSSLASFQRHAVQHYGAAVGEVTEGLQTHQLYVLQTAVISLAVTALSLVVLAQYDVWFLAVMLPFMLAICGLPMLLASRAGRYLDAEPAAFAALGHFAETVVAGRRGLHFAPPENLQAQGERLLDRLHHAQAGKWWIWNLSFNLKLTLNLTLSALTLLVGGLLHLQGQISLGTVIGGYLMVAMVAPKFDGLYKLYNFAQASAAAYDTLDRFALPLAALPQGAPGPGPDDPVRSISLDVSGYGPGDAPVVIKRASLSLQAGDRCLITGPSGSGKSTLIDLLLGSLVAPGVEVTVNGLPLAAYGLDRYWRAIAYVPNPDLLFDRISAEDNLALFGDPAALERSGLGNALGWKSFAATPAAGLSGGERQRLSLLRALSRGRSVIVLDEPTSALDEANMRAAFELLVQARPAILIAASHDRGAEGYFNRRFEMRDGQLVELA